MPTYNETNFKSVYKKDLRNEVFENILGNVRKFLDDMDKPKRRRKNVKK